MGTTNIRLAEDLHKRARGYAADIGLTINALIAVALAEYLAARQKIDSPGKPGPEQSIALSQAVPSPANFRLEPSAPTVSEGGKSRQVRRQESKAGNKATKSQGNKVTK